MKNKPVILLLLGCAAIVVLLLMPSGGREHPEARERDKNTPQGVAAPAVKAPPAPVRRATKEQFLQAETRFREHLERPRKGLFRAFETLDFGTISLGKMVNTVKLEWGITGAAFGGAGSAHTQEQWHALLQSAQESGEELKVIRFGKSSFIMNADGSAVSRMPYAMEGKRGNGDMWSAQGSLAVHWTSDVDSALPFPSVIEAKEGMLKVHAAYRAVIGSPESFPAPDNEADLIEIAALHAERKKLDETTWAKEALAQQYEQTIVKYWDQMLRQEDEKYDVLASVPFDWIAFGKRADTQVLDWGITHSVFGGDKTKLNQEGWRSFLTEMQGSGYKIVNVEFHQSKFDTNGTGEARSTFSSEFHVKNAEGTHRWIIKADLNIQWSDDTDLQGRNLIKTIDVDNLRIYGREAPLDTFKVHSGIDNLVRFERQPSPIVYDLDRDGLSEIILPRHNLVLRDAGTNTPRKTPLFEAPGVGAPNGTRMAAIVADFTGDGHPDIFCTGYYETAQHLHDQTGDPAALLFVGDPDGHFRKRGQPVHKTPLLLEKPIGVTAGDVDGDGDLDIWLFQYKAPYRQGQLPTPFYDANDGYPSYLLLNDGGGHFSDATEAAGLGPKRHRRTYSASFVDLDGDNDLDLLVVNDFAGIDVYANDGSGHFTDITKGVVDEASNFGMAHTFSDYNLDGRMDFYVTGMASTTMRRLEYMGLAREDFPEHTEMRSRMGYGSRMYMGQANKTYRQPFFRDQVARSGWSWGTTSFDFDSDGDMDIYVANGHMSGKTTQDYCTRYWCHDVYTGSSNESAALSGYFKDTLDIPLGTLSWDGYQKNNLFMNLSGKGFINVGFLMDAALVQDSRIVISDDFDGDGRPDLLVSYLQYDSNKPTYHLRILQNNWPIANNWIGVRLQDAPGLPSPIGAKITIQYSKGELNSWVVTGDSFRSQHAPMKHFGLGSEDRVDSVTVRWPNGSVWSITDPEINRYHIVNSISDDQTPRNR